ncbi:hypothetical protein [Sinosporangium siamense]|uniref:Lipoprotein n=1 Tax=Sinosporangium siamense TaxID=1367973 RepID=A0A919RHL0_9ACTN|nr:hypothetical protein [Sinosporangium siamense]GII93477.1 hypothetical protein Ssi02_37080 [Sinosporangium siamense]
MKNFASILVLGLTLTACGTGVAAVGEHGTPTKGPATVRVWNLHGNERGRADQRPANLVLSEFTSMNGLRWSTWGPDRAVGNGKVSGTWCLPGCASRPYAATVTLSDVRRGYFTRFEVGGTFPRPERRADTLTGTLPTP